MALEEKVLSAIGCKHAADGVAVCTGRSGKPQRHIDYADVVALHVGDFQKR